MLEAARTSRNASRLFAGMVVLALGVMALLDNFGIIRIHDIWSFWPLILVAVGLARLIRPEGSPGRFPGVIFLLLGLWLLLENIGVWHYSLSELWPLFVVLIGGWLIWGGWSHRMREAPTDASSQVNSFAMLGGTEYRGSSADFQGGDATAILGGCKVDLRAAGLKSGQAVLHALAIWGGVEIVVPREWNVEVQGTPILGGFEDKTEHPRESGGPRLIVRGVAIMGGVEIKN